MINNQTVKPLRHYQSVYQDLDPKEIARRCNLEFDSITSSFSLRVLGTEYHVPHPVFALLDSKKLDSEIIEVTNAYEKILFIHYLCEGKYFPPQGRRLSYNEIPWGSVYYRNFEGRVLKRCALALGRDIPSLAKMIEQNPGLRAAPQDLGDGSWRIEFINGLYITLILWQADDEFPPSAQILFDDNFVFAFTAEDLAVAGEIITERLKKMLICKQSKGE